MARITLNNQTVPSTPSSGNTTLYTETTQKRLMELNDAGAPFALRSYTNATTTTQSISANTNTYITGASLAIPYVLRVGTIFRWVIELSKDNAQTGTTAPSWTVVYGTNASISDTARLTFTGVAPTNGVADDQIVMIDALIRSVGGSGVISGVYFATHIGAAATQVTGLMNQPTDVKKATGTFDTTVASSTIGVGVNLGANTAGTINHVSVVAWNL